MSGPSHEAPPKADPLDRTRWPLDEWRLVESRFEMEDRGVSESLFSVGNGYLGLRGNFEESRDFANNGTYLNGFHETFAIRHAEEAFGFAKTGQTIINAPDAKVIRLYVDDEPLEVSTAELLDYERALDVRTGVLTRSLIWRTPSGKKVRVVSKRMASFVQRHLAVLTFEVTLLDSPAPITISSQLLNREDGNPNSVTSPGEGFDPRKAEKVAGRILVPEIEQREGERICLGYRAENSKMTVAVAADHELITECQFQTRYTHTDDVAKATYRIQGEPNTPILLQKTVAYHTGRVVAPHELLDRCERTLDRVAEQGVEQQFADQRAWLADFWARADVEIAGKPALQQAVRWNLFSVAQASMRADGTGISAKGVTGSGYGGHYFWDTEVYVLPFLTYTSPDTARNALRYRLSLLDSSRQRARELAQRGALFPWRTINGEEASAYYAAGTAQYHIDADVAYALSQYLGATGDEEFMCREAIDIFVETARLWTDLGFWRNEHGGTFHIHGVTGPDEYTTVVNDNLYTNVMARFNLRRAADAVDHLAHVDQGAYEAMIRRVDLDVAEVTEWRRCAEGMFIPFDDHLGIHPQDAHFLEREMWDLGQTPLSKRPLLLNYHPLVIYRFQVLKQADVVLALFLQGEDFTHEEKRRDFDYYDPITTGDSTLSAVVQSIIAAEVGYQDLALRYFLSALFVDLADQHSNTSEGVHIASTGGVWSALVCGFGGFRDLGNEQWCFDPRLPVGWDQLVFRITLRGTRVRVTLTGEKIAFFVEDGPGGLVFTVRDAQVTVEAGEETSVALEGQGPVLEGEPKNPAGTLRADGTVISATVPSGE